VNALITLLGEASTLSGKKFVNDAIGVVIERVGDKILPFLPTLAQAIPALWHGSGGLEGEWLFKASLVVLTTKLVTVSLRKVSTLMSGGWSIVRSTDGTGYPPDRRIPSPSRQRILRGGRTDSVGAVFETC
jgi:hypothetical protein